MTLFSKFHLLEEEIKTTQFQRPQLSSSGPNVVAPSTEMLHSCPSFLGIKCPSCLPENMTHFLPSSEIFFINFAFSFSSIFNLSPFPGSALALPKIFHWHFLPILILLSLSAVFKRNPTLTLFSPSLQYCNWVISPINLEIFVKIISFSNPMAKISYYSIMLLYLSAALDITDLLLFPMFFLDFTYSTLSWVFS